jgi:hypothetical protein
MKDLHEVLRSGTAAQVRDYLLRDSRAITREASWRPDGRHSEGGGRLFWEALQSPVERLEKLRALAAAGADVNTTALPKGATLATHALIAGEFELLKLLVSLGADLGKPDRRGLTPLGIAELKEDTPAISLLRSRGAEPAPEAGTATAEQAFLIERPLCAEIHETLKWAIRGAGFEIARIRIPGPWDSGAIHILYWLDRFRIRLEVLQGPTVALALEDGETGEPLADLLPPGAAVTNTLLRGHLITFLKGIREPGGFSRRPESGQGLAEAHGAWALLGVSTESTREEITRAYRRLAKAYHPDRQGGDEAKMRAVNLAYEEIVKKKH